MSSTLSASTARPPDAPLAVARPWLAARALAQREWLRFFRQRSRVLGAVGQPLVFWLLFGAGLGPTFRLPVEVPPEPTALESVSADRIARDGTTLEAGASAAGAGEPSVSGALPAGLSYREYFFPGTLVLIVLFTAIFTTISIIEDRREGFLQAVLVAPVPRWSLVLGKLSGGTLVALPPAIVFLLLGFWLPLGLGLAQAAAIVALITVLAFALTGLGFLFAWRTDSTQGFHAVMSVLLFPMWLLSGAFFPAHEGLLGWILRLNPLSYGVAGVRHLLFANVPAALPSGLPSAGTCWLVTWLFAGAMFVVACGVASRTGRSVIR